MAGAKYQCGGHNTLQARLCNRATAKHLVWLSKRRVKQGAPLPVLCLGDHELWVPALLPALER